MRTRQKIRTRQKMRTKVLFERHIKYFRRNFLRNCLPRCAVACHFVRALDSRSHLVLRGSLLCAETSRIPRPFFPGKIDRAKLAGRISAVGGTHGGCVTHGPYATACRGPCISYFGCRLWERTRAEVATSVRAYECVRAIVVKLISGRSAHQLIAFARDGRMRADECDRAVSSRWKFDAPPGRRPARLRSLDKRISVFGNSCSPYLPCPARPPRRTPMPRLFDGSLTGSGRRRKGKCIRASLEREDYSSRLSANYRGSANLSRAR